jgi:hypothetical protein
VDSPRGAAVGSSNFGWSTVRAQRKATGVLVLVEALATLGAARGVDGFGEGRGFAGGGIFSNQTPY